MAKKKVKITTADDAIDNGVGKITQIVIDSEESDDWIRSLEGYRESEAAIHDELSRKYGTGQSSSE